MHIQKILNLVNDAPTIALWWSKNKRLSKYWSFALYAVCAPLGLICGISCVVGGLMMGISMMGGVVDTKLEVSIASMCLSALGTGLLSFAAIWLLNWYCPKNLHYNGLKFHQEAFKVEQQQQVKALNTALKITDPQLKEVLGKLQQLKDVELPNAWWEQFVLHTQAAYDQQSCDLKKSAPSEIPVDPLNDVYIEIQRQWIANQTSSTPKVLKL